MHPLIDTDLSKLSDAEIEDKIKELTKKYFSALQFSPTVTTQILMMLDDYKNEQEVRKFQQQNQNKDDGANFDDLINIG